MERNHISIQQLTARGYRSGDEPRILEMFNEVFHENRTLEHWYWKYRDHPWGTGCISLTESEQKRLAAHYGGYPVWVSNFSGHSLPDKFKTFHLGDKMSRPEFRGSGFRKKSPLALAFFHFMSRHGQELPFGYGFGTGHSLRLGRLLFGYMDVEPIPFRVLDAGAGKRSIRKTVSALAAGIRVEQACSAGDEFSGFFNRVGRYYNCLTSRTADYLNWRYLRHPDRRYVLMVMRKKGRMTGWSVFQRSGAEIQWVDALFDPEFVHWSGFLLECIQREESFKDAQRIVCWFPDRPEWWSKVLEDLGFSSMAEPNGLHFTGPVFNYPGAENFLQSFFYYAMGDSDLF